MGPIVSTCMQFDAPGIWDWRASHSLLFSFLLFLALKFFFGGGGGGGKLLKKDTMVGKSQCRVHLRWDGLILVITEHKNLVQFLSLI